MLFLWESGMSLNGSTSSTSCVGCTKENRKDPRWAWWRAWLANRDPYRQPQEMFQSVSLEYSELFAWVLLTCITAFRRWNLPDYQTTKQNYFHHLFQLATSCCTFIQLNCKLLAIFAIFNISLLILSPLLTLIFLLETIWNYLYLYINW